MNIKKELLFSIIISIISSLVMLFISLIGNKSSWITISIYIAVLILTIIILNFQQPLIYILSSPGSWILKKNWISNWNYIKNGENVEIQDKITLKQLGTYVYGAGISTQISGKFSFNSAKYIVKGNINREGIINGTWKNINSGRNYYGTFILKCKRNGLVLEGKWTGISDNGINTGNWLWKVNNNAEED